jgi:hypothetical protein
LRQGCQPYVPNCFVANVYLSICLSVCLSVCLPTHLSMTAFTSFCLTAASNGGRSPSSGFPNSPRPHPPASHISQLNYYSSLYSPGTNCTENVSSIIACYRGNNVPTELFPSNGCYTVPCLHSCYLAMGLHVTLFKISKS